MSKMKREFTQVEAHAMHHTLRCILAHAKDIEGPPMLRLYAIEAIVQQQLVSMELPTMPLLPIYQWVRSTCPHCESDNLSDRMSDNVASYVDVTCIDCGYQWTEPTPEDEEADE